MHERVNQFSTVPVVDGLEIIGLVKKNINRGYAVSIKLN